MAEVTATCKKKENNFKQATLSCYAVTHSSVSVRFVPHKWTTCILANDPSAALYLQLGTLCLLL